MADHLYILLRSLSKTEKRYFRVRHASNGRGENARFLKLFDLLVQMESFDLEVVKREMEWKNFKSSYTMAKRYLYDKVLDTLSDFHQTGTDAAELAREVSHIRVLSERQLSKLALRKIARAKRKAYQTENLSILLELLQKELEIKVRESHQIAKPEVMGELFGEMEWAMEGWRLVLAMRKCNYSFSSQIRMRGRPSKHEDFKWMEEVLLEARALAPLEQPYIRPKIFFLNLLGQYHFLKGDSQSSMEALLEACALFQERPSLKQTMALHYVGILHNVINRSMLVRNFAQAARLLGELYGFLPKSEKVQTKRKESYFLLGLSLVSNACQFRENLPFLNEIKHELSQANTRIAKAFQLNLHLGLFYAHFALREWRLALYHLREAFNDSTHLQIRVFERCIPLLEILLHYELGNVDWLEYRLKARRVAVGKNPPYAFEAHFLKHIGDILPIQKEEEVRTRFSIFRKIINRVQQDPAEQELFNLFDFGAWANAKALGKRFLDVQAEAWAMEGGMEIRVKPLAKD